MREITPYGMISNAISCSSLRYVPISGDRTKEESENGRYTAGKPTGMVQRPDREHEEGMDYQRGAGGSDRCHVRGIKCLAEQPAVSEREAESLVEQAGAALTPAVGAEMEEPVDTSEFGL